MRDRGRGVFLDQRRARELVAGLQRRPVIGRRLDESAAGEIHRALAAERRGVRLGPAFGDMLERWLSHLADHCAAKADDLGLLAGDRKSIAGLVHRIEQPLDAVAVLRREQIDRQVDGDGVLLADVAHIGRAPHLDARERLPAPDGFAALPLHLGENLFHRREGGVGQRREPGAHEVAAKISHQHAISGEMSRRSRNDDDADRQLARHRRGVQRSGAAIGDEREVGGVEAALGGHPAHHMGHFRRGDAEDTLRGFDGVEAERRRNLFGESVLRRGEIELHLAAEEAVGAEVGRG